MFKPSRISAAVATLILGAHLVPAHAGASLYSFGTVAGTSPELNKERFFSPRC